MIGLSYDQFWSMTPNIYGSYRNAYVENEKEKVKQADFLNHILGRYVALGVNDPKNYPEQAFLSTSREPQLQEMTDEEMERQAKRNTIRMGGTIKT